MPKERSDVWQDSSRFVDGFRIMQGEQEYITYKSQSSIRIWPSEEAFRYERHFHSAVEIILTLRGEVTIEMPTQTIRVGENQILVIPSDSPHSLAMGEDSKRLLFLFEPVMVMNMRDISYMTSVWSQPIYLNEDSELRSRITALLLKVNEIYEAHEPMWNTMCYSYLLQVYAILGQYYLKRVTKPANGSRIDPEIMNSAMAYIRQNYMDVLTLDDVANFVGFSRHYFSRTFKQFTGIAFSSFLTATRLDAAEDKLVFSDLPIQDIAFQCGFSSIATFNRVFKEYRKCTPSQYRLVYSERVRSERMNELPREEEEK